MVGLPSQAACGVQQEASSRPLWGARGSSALNESAPSAAWLASVGTGASAHGCERARLRARTQARSVWIQAAPAPGSQGLNGLGQPTSGVLSTARFAIMPSIIICSTRRLATKYLVRSGLAWLAQDCVCVRKTPMFCLLCRVLFPAACCSIQFFLLVAACS